MHKTVAILCPKCESVMMYIKLSKLTNTILSIEYISYEYGKDVECPFDGEKFWIGLSKKLYTDIGWV